MIRLQNTLSKEGCNTRILYSKLPPILPSWLKIPLFNLSVCRSKYNKHNKRLNSCTLYFALDRITCPDIYRAGDGVHKAFLKTKGMTLNPLHIIYLWLEKRTFENAKIVIANSRMVKNQILEYYPTIEEKKIRIIYNGIPIPKDFQKNEAKKRLAKTYDFDVHLPVILFVGSGFERKGVTEFLQILAKIDRPFRAFVVGKEKKIKRYQAMANRLGLNEKLIFTGPRTDVERFYAASDLFLFPTHYEPFSNVVLEAMSYENVVFTTRLNGASEILEEKFVMKSPTDFSVAKKIEGLLENSSELKSEQKKARAISKNFSIQRNVSQTLELIREVSGQTNKHKEGF